MLNKIVDIDRVWKNSSVVKSKNAERMVIGSNTTKANFFENEQKISCSMKQCFNSIFRRI